jgi:CRISPR-associated protein Cas5h
MEQIDKVLIFDIWSDFAHFRKIETTTSPLTYSIPTGTALSGIISAIIGQERDSYYELFFPENAKLGIRLLNPLKKIRININLIKTDDGFYLWDNILKGAEPRSPTPFEFVKKPKYRIYIWLKDKKLQKKLKDFLQNHQSFYTPYLGISGMIANFNFVGEFNANQESKNEENIHTVARMDKIGQPIVEEGKTYIKERIPIFMNRNRVIQEYADILFEANGRPLKVRDTIFYKIGEENVIFL